ncbi:hypothetical protein V6N13_146694 [Hibiscus sabdariffa]
MEGRHECGHGAGGGGAEHDILNSSSASAHCHYFDDKVNCKAVADEYTEWSLLKTSARFSRDLLLAILISSYIKTLLSSHCHDGLLSNATWPSD